LGELVLELELPDVPPAPLWKVELLSLELPLLSLLF
jgi:hypothetical protein